ARIDSPLDIFIERPLLSHSHAVLTLPATTELDTLPLHDALPIFDMVPQGLGRIDLFVAAIAIGGFHEDIIGTGRWLGILHDCVRSEEHTSELQSRRDLVCRLLLEKKKHGLSTLAQVSGRCARRSG